MDKTNKRCAAAHCILKPNETIVFENYFIEISEPTCQQYELDVWRLLEPVKQLRELFLFPNRLVAYKGAFIGTYEVDTPEVMLIEDINRLAIGGIN